MPDTRAELPSSRAEVSGDGPQHDTVAANHQSSYTPPRPHCITKSRTHTSSRRSSTLHGFSDNHLANSPSPSEEAPKRTSTISSPLVQQMPVPRHVAIGMIFSNGEAGQDQYKCAAPGCHNQTFGRLAELKRHHAGKHAAISRRPHFWCPVEDCERSKTGQERRFQGRIRCSIICRGCMRMLCKTDEGYGTALARDVVTVGWNLEEFSFIPVSAHFRHSSSI